MTTPSQRSRRDAPVADSAGLDPCTVDPPPPGRARPVAPGVWWLRMPLPFALDHVNLWALEDGDGWTLVDSGIATDETRTLWRTLLTGDLAGRPVRRLVCTHFHPDHMGLSGWLCDHLKVPLWAPLAEWAFGRQLAALSDAEFAGLSHAFHQRAGCDDSLLSKVSARGNVYRCRVVDHPLSLTRLRPDQAITIDGRAWRVVIGHGHSPEHAGLWCPEARVLISGDQVLPRISPNVSVWPTEPNEDPLSLFLDSLKAWRARVPDDVLVLPSHGPPFTGLHARIESLLRHHDSRLDETAALCRDGARAAFDLVACLFRRPLDDHQVFFAIGETLAHLHHLADRERLRVLAPDGLGVVRFRAP